LRQGAVTGLLCDMRSCTRNKSALRPLTPSPTGPHSFEASALEGNTPAGGAMCSSGLRLSAIATSTLSRRARQKVAKSADRNLSFPVQRDYVQEKTLSSCLVFTKTPPDTPDKHEEKGCAPGAQCTPRLCRAKAAGAPIFCCSVSVQLISSTQLTLAHTR
jgi:hypothetical protein